MTSETSDRLRCPQCKRWLTVQRRNSGRLGVVVGEQRSANVNRIFNQDPIPDSDYARASGKAYRIRDARDVLRRKSWRDYNR